MAASPASFVSDCPTARAGSGAGSDAYRWAWSSSRGAPKVSFLRQHMNARNQDLASGLSGRYAVERELGHGGMATVWLARDLRYDRLVALKVLRPELAASLGGQRFLREIMLAARLDRKSVV